MSGIKEIAERTSIAAEVMTLEELKDHIRAMPEDEILAVTFTEGENGGENSDDRDAAL